MVASQSDTRFLIDGIGEVTNVVIFRLTQDYKVNCDNMKLK